ncbi:hypothetical protein AVEN_163931-1, partial [Araneus ventricosus]
MLGQWTADRLQLGDSARVRRGGHLRPAPGAGLVPAHPPRGRHQLRQQGGLHAHPQRSHQAADTRQVPHRSDRRTAAQHRDGDRSEGIQESEEDRICGEVRLPCRLCWLVLR